MSLLFFVILLEYLSNVDEGTDFGRVSGVLSAPVTATPGMQAAGLQSSLNPLGKDMGKTKTHELEEEADLVSDPESSISSEIEEPPSTSPQNQYPTASSSSRSELLFKVNEIDLTILMLFIWF